MTIRTIKTVYGDLSFSILRRYVECCQERQALLDALQDMLDAFGASHHRPACNCCQCVAWRNARDVVGQIKRIH